MTRFCTGGNTVDAQGAPFFQIYRLTLNDDGATSAVIVSRDPAVADTAGNNHSGHPSISDDGNVVVFDSLAALVTTDTTGLRDVYAHDIAAGTTTLVSHADGMAGTPGNRPSDTPAVSGNGGFVAYTSLATDLGGSVTPVGEPEVYRTGADGTGTEILSTAAALAFAGGASTAELELNDPMDPNDDFDAVGSVISDDGGAVVFQGSFQADGLHEIWRWVEGDIPPASEISILVPGLEEEEGHHSRNPTLNLLAAESFFDAAEVAFSSVDMVLDPPAIDIEDVFWLQWLQGAPASLNVTAGPGEQDGLSTLPMLSESGLSLTLTSLATGLVPGDTNSAADVFLAEIDPAPSVESIERVSEATDGMEANGASLASDLSELVVGVRSFVFESDATNLLGTGVDNNGFRDIFERREAEGTLFRRGNANGDAQIDLTDAVFVLNFLFRSGAAPGCQDAADADDTGQINLTDGVYILRYLFVSNSPPPPAPGPDTCGHDLTRDGLGCVTGCP